MSGPTAKMKLSCIPVSYFGRLISEEMSIPEWIEQAVNLGLDGIDVSTLFFKSREAGVLHDLRTRIEDADLALAILNTYSDLTHPDAERRGSETGQLFRDIRMASLLGAEYVRVVTGPQHPETATEDGIRWSVESFVRAASIAQDCGVRLVYENHSKPISWERPDFSFPPDVFLAIADMLAGTPVMILFDTANPLAYGVEPLPILERVIDRVACVHAADTSARGHLQPSQIGRGLVPFRQLFRRLKESGFSGWISIEEASGTGDAGMRSAVHAVRQAWREA